MLQGHKTPMLLYGLHNILLKLFFINTNPSLTNLFSSTTPTNYVYLAFTLGVLSKPLWVSQCLRYEVGHTSPYFITREVRRHLESHVQENHKPGSCFESVYVCVLMRASFLTPHQCMTKYDWNITYKPRTETWTDITLSSKTHCWHVLGWDDVKATLLSWNTCI